MVDDFDVEVNGEKYHVVVKNNPGSRKIETETVIDGKVKELKATYTEELALDLKSLIGIDVEKVLKEILVEETSKEIEKLVQKKK